MTSALIPPRFVPTLTDVAQISEYTPKPISTVVKNEQFEEQIVHRVMQRVDLVLERRLREAVSQVILVHTQALVPRLREEIETAVRESVLQALAQELPQQIL